MNSLVINILSMNSQNPHFPSTVHSVTKCLNLHGINTFSSQTGICNMLSLRWVKREDGILKWLNRVFHTEHNLLALILISSNLGYRPQKVLKLSHDPVMLLHHCKNLEWNNSFVLKLQRVMFLRVCSVDPVGLSKSDVYLGKTQHTKCHA